MLGDGVRIGRNATVGPMVVLGAGVFVHPGAHVEDSVIWDEAHVLPESLVRHSVIGRTARVGGRVRNGLCEDGGRLIGAGRAGLS
jgi:mannose-1-phosphate guanylyltransferase